MTRGTEGYQNEVFGHVLAILGRDEGLIKPNHIELSGTFPDTEVVVSFTSYAGRDVTTRYRIWGWWNDVEEWELAGEVAGNLAGAIIEDLTSPP